MGAPKVALGVWGIDWRRGQWLYFVGFNDTLVIGTFSQVHYERTVTDVSRRGSEEPSEVPGELLGCPEGTLVGR